MLVVDICSLSLPNQFVTSLQTPMLHRESHVEHIDKTIIFPQQSNKSNMHQTCFEVSF